VRTKRRSASAPVGSAWPAVRVDNWRNPDVAADGLRALVAATLAERSAEPGRALARAFLEEDDIDAAALCASTAVTILLGWLVGAREHSGASGEDPLGPAAVEWVRANLGNDEAGQGLTLAGTLDHPQAPQLTMAGAVEQLGDALLPALLWLAAGLTATAGRADPDWLGHFDPP
jgi:hypothetical protein